MLFNLSLGLINFFFVISKPRSSRNNPDVPVGWEGLGSNGSDEGNISRTGGCWPALPLYLSPWNTILLQHIAFSQKLISVGMLFGSSMHPASHLGTSPSQ